MIDRIIYRFIVLLLFVLIACGEESIEDCLTPIYESKILTDSKIRISQDEFGNIFRDYEEGDKLVFEHSEIIDCENVIDEESFIYISFEVEEDVSSFKYDDSPSLQQFKSNFYRTGAWFKFTIPLAEGLIQGEKKGRLWEVDMKLDIYFPAIDSLETSWLFRSIDTTIVF
jgi:hypothetical protein